MLSRIFPANFNNEYRGTIFGLIIFALISLMKLLMGLNISGLNPFISPEHILQTVDGIPLDKMPEIAASSVIGTSRAWAILMLLLASLDFVALFRYRAMIPLLFCFHLLDHMFRKYFEIAKSGFDFSKPMEMGDMINWSLIIALVIGLILSAYGGKRAN